MLGSYLKICSPVRLAYGVIISFGKRVGGGESALGGSGTRGPFRSHACLCCADFRCRRFLHSIAMHGIASQSEA